MSLTLNPASRTALVGCSGAGKSLTCAALAGTLPPGLTATGSLTVSSPRDEPGTTTPPPRAPNLLDLPAAMRPRGSRIALVPQDPTTSLHPLISVGRQIALAAAAAGLNDDEATARAIQMLDAVGLDEPIATRVPGRLSGGQRQRACLALALAGKPAVILADEPTTALDVIARAKILRLLTDLTDSPMAPALLLITHDLPAATTCETIAVLSEGKVVETGPTREVLSNPSHPVTVAMCDAAADETLDGALAAVELHDAADGAAA